MKGNKHIQSFNEHQENLNISDVSDSNCITIIKDLLKNGDINTIARIWSDYNSKISPDKYKEIQKLTDNSIYKEQIDSLVRGMLGIGG
jgi:hypothetical protein